MKTLIHCRRELWDNKISIHIANRTEEGKLSIYRPPVLDHVDEAVAHSEPCLLLQTGDAQTLMDELWICGLRPSEGTGSAGSLAATERHLNDMRDIAKGLLRKDEVEI